MSKPDWKYSPEGYDWLAMDESGAWFWYDAKPVAMSVSWVNDGGEFKLAGVDDSDLPWTETLDRRP